MMTLKKYKSMQNFEKKKLSKAYSEFRSKQDKEWTLNFFNKDEAWYEETLKKVQEIKSTLPKDIEPREEIKKDVRLDTIS